ncbi:hypothetical protein T4D_6051 [Trichinella pseudospiralis]|uniref:Uncharacterized protein n=1 Tax=Trichinella pseudospiralis TaxID=6337 RepID=A0A0V1DR39_TRIPS|nr:hypothetical protein T4D_6051 [Trichinella pseudospiralis]
MERRELVVCLMNRYHHEHVGLINCIFCRGDPVDRKCVRIVNVSLHISI